MIKIKQTMIEELSSEKIKYYYDILSDDNKIGYIVLVDRGYLKPVLIERFNIFEEFITVERCVYALDYVIFLSKFFRTRTLEFHFDVLRGKYVKEVIDSLKIAHFNEFDERRGKVFKLYR